VLNRLIKEVKEYTKNPVSDIVLQVNEANVTDIRADLQGPGNTLVLPGLVRSVPGPDLGGFCGVQLRRRTTAACSG